MLSVPPEKCDAIILSTITWELGLPVEMYKGPGTIFLTYH